MTMWPGGSALPSTLLPMSLSTRGQGRVGEMTQLLSTAFEHTEEQARRLKDTNGTSRGAVILLVDEADAIAQSREASQMHHEDRAGVNAFIRGIDRLGNGKYPAAVIMCTNRLGALDPAVQRRAADILTFARPGRQATYRRASITPSPVGSFRAADYCCGQCYRSRQEEGYGFTFSDLTQRLLPAIVLDAYPDNAVDRIERLGSLEPWSRQHHFRRRIMSEWSLRQLLAGLHDDIQRRLETARQSFGHPGTKGDASENVWLALLNTYLPERYQAAKAHVVDSNGTFSDQIDVVVYDRQYSPFIFRYEDQIIIPAESVYAVFEAKQTLSKEHIEYARKKVASVRRLHRTSLPIPHAGGTYPPKPLIPICGGLLTLESDWKPALGEPLYTALGNGMGVDHLDLGCVAAHGYFRLDEGRGAYKSHSGGKPATAFLLTLISRFSLVVQFQ